MKRAMLLTPGTSLGPSSILAPRSRIYVLQSTDEPDAGAIQLRTGAIR